MEQSRPRHFWKVAKSNFDDVYLDELMRAARFREAHPKTPPKKSYPKSIRRLRPR